MPCRNSTKPWPLLTEQGNHLLVARGFTSRSKTSDANLVHPTVKKFRLRWLGVYAGQSPMIYLSLRTTKRDSAVLFRHGAVEENLLAAAT